MKSSTYTADPKNARAVAHIRSWLLAVNIPCSFANEAGCDLTVTRKDGSTARVAVVLDNNEAAEGALVVQAKVITGRSIQDAFQEFHNLANSLGYLGIPDPVNRGPLPTRNSYKDFELSVLRHKDFRRVPNPSTDHLLRYKPVMEKVVWRFIRSNHELCKDNGLEYADLMSMAMAWTCIYIGRSELPDEQSLENNNEKRLYSALLQRFVEYRNALFQRLRAVHPAIQDYSIAMTDFPNLEGESVFREADQVYKVRKSKRNGIDRSTPSKRRATCAELLARELGKLSEEKRVELLQEAVLNTHIGRDARREAARILREMGHSPAQDIGPEESEELAGGDEGGGEE